MQSHELFDRWDKQERVRYFVKHALNVLQYKDLATADVDTPIVVLLPHRSSLEQDHAKFISDFARDMP